MKPGSIEWRAHLASLCAEESTKPMRWWYLSFAAPGEFRGGVIVQERGFTLALRKTHALGINPGGQVASIEIGADLPPSVPLTMTDRLLTRAELEGIGK